MFNPACLADKNTSYLLENDSSLKSSKDCKTLVETPFIEFKPYLMFLPSILKSMSDLFKSGGKSFISKWESSWDILAISSCELGSNLAYFKRLKKNSCGYVNFK